MNATRPVGVLILLLWAVQLPAAATPPMDFEGAKWIWYDAGLDTPLGQLPAGSIYLRATFTVPADARLQSAVLAMTADNLYTFHLNGKSAGESLADPNAWAAAKRFDVTRLLVPGRNVLAVEAINTAPGPAGLLARLVIRTAAGKTIEVVSDSSWMGTDREETNWQQPQFSDKAWRAAQVVADYGLRPWGRVIARAPAELAGEPLSHSREELRSLIRQHKAAARSAGIAPPSRTLAEVPPPVDYPWPAAVAYLADDCSLYRPQQHAGNAFDSLSVTVFNARKSRAYPEHDLPSPIKMGRKLMLLAPARPDGKPQVLLDAGQGAIGTPCATFDGQSLLVTMARDREPFFHIYRVPVAGGAPQRLTDGPFHDIDPAELPDGRIVFTSTRVGMYDEYHSPPARALFVMNADGSDIHPITNTFIFDNEAKVTAEGRILFLREDNFFDRGKVETLLHAVHPDGTEGYTEFGLENGPEYGGRLRAFYCGSPAPMADGRVAFVSNGGITVGRPGSASRTWRNLPVEAGDVAALPDGRLLCTVARRIASDIPAAKTRRASVDFRYEKLTLVEMSPAQDTLTVLYETPGEGLSSPVFVGPRARPPVIPEKTDRRAADAPHPTGFLFCGNVRYTKNNTAGWPHVRAIRVLAGKGLTVRSSHSYIVHAGSEAVELGTVPLAPDGSFYVEVPADTAIAFQAVDAEGRSELNEMSWIYVRPGERRGCVGCHASRQATPPFAPSVPLATLYRPLRLTGEGHPHRFRANNAAVTGLMEMQFDRYREVASLNQHGETPDPLATPAQEVAARVAELSSPEEGLRTSAAGRLAIFRERAAAPALAAALGDRSREVRVAAAMALAACGTRDSVTPLLNTLEDDDPLVAQAAAIALENFTDHAQPFAPFATLRQRREQATAWRAWFAAHPWPAIEADLVQQLRQDDRDQQRRAAVALGHIGSDAARAALRQYVTAQRGTNPYAESRKTVGYHGDNAKFNASSPLNPRTLQEATRALGYLQDPAAVPLLGETLLANTDPKDANLFLAEAAVEALGRIGTPQAEALLQKALGQLTDYFFYVGWYGDHPALFACHGSPVHIRIAEAFDRLGAKQLRPLVPNLIRMLPTDFDRALFPYNDDCETLVGRVIRRTGAEAEVVETCLALLGDPQGKRTEDVETAIRTVYAAWGGKPDPENRAAQVLSLVCRDPAYVPRLVAALERYRARPNGEIPRVFDTGIPNVQQLPIKHWVCFFLARTLGNLADPRALDALIAALDQSPPEAALGYPSPTGPGVLFLHNDLTPCWRAAIAWALGRGGDPRAVPVLLKTVSNLHNAPDTRHAAAEALGRIHDPASRATLRRLAENYPEVSTRKALVHAANDGAKRELAIGGNN